MTSVREAFLAQSATCAELGSPFTARLCRLVAERLEPGDAVADRVLNWTGNPAGRADALPLRLAGALHGLVIEDRDPGLAAVYPPHQARASDDALWSAVSRAFIAHPRFLLTRLAFPPLTNECLRSAALCPGFLTIAAKTGLPLVMSELGASAGLNLNWDRYAYRFGDALWGRQDSPVRIAPAWTGAPPPLADARVLERAGCDRAPPDVKREADRLLLESYVWADQTERRERLRAAMRIMSDTGLQVIARDALDWLTDRLSLRFQGATHVIYHSIVWQYLDRLAQVDAVERLSEAGRRATREAPLAWLRLESDGKAPGGAILLTLWPQGETRILARSDFHGRWIDWQGWG